MKKTFDLGMSVVAYRGHRRHLSVTVEFGGQWYRKPEDGYFVISGIIGGELRWITCGQCQKEIRQLCHPKWYAFMDELLDLDEKYWLRRCKCIPTKDANRIKEIINQ